MSAAGCNLLGLQVPFEILLAISVANFQQCKTKCDCCGNNNNNNKTNNISSNKHNNNNNNNNAS